MARATITLIDTEGRRVTREAEDACFDGDCLLLTYSKGAFAPEEVINMKSPEFCSVRFHREAQIREGPCVVGIIRMRMARERS